MIEIPVETTRHPKVRPDEGALGFGRYFSDHMFVADYTEAKKWHGARVVPYQNLALDPAASVLHYGQALFEGMKAFRGDDGKIRLFRPQMNWNRLKTGAERLCMQVPDYEMFLEGIRQVVKADRDWVPSKTGTALYIRPTLIGSEAFLGVRPSEQYLYYVILSPVGSYYDSGLDAVKIWIEREYARACPGGIGSVKAGGNYASSLKAARDAKTRGFAQVLWLDAREHRFIEEVGTMNVFFVLENKVITPALSGSILPGVMRDSVIQTLKSWNIPVEERPVELKEILTAQKDGTLREVFGSGTAAQVTPVGEFGTVDGMLKIGHGGVGSTSQKLFNYFLDLNYGRKSDDHGWLMEV